MTIAVTAAGGTETSSPTDFNVEARAVAGSLSQQLGARNATAAPRSSERRAPSSQQRDVTTRFIIRQKK